MPEGIQLSINLDDNTSKKLDKVEDGLGDIGKKVNKESKNWGRKFKKMGSAADKVGRKVGAIGAKLGIVAAAAGGAAAFGMAALVKKGILFNAQLETINTQYRVMTGSQEKANRLMAETVKFSATTPFQVGEVAEARKILMGFGFPTVDMLRDVGDAAAFATRPITEIANLMGRASQRAGFGEAINQLQQLAVITRPQLEGEGLIFDKAGSYKGSMEDAMVAIRNIVQRNFGGMMDEMSKTWTGGWSTMVDNLNLAIGNQCLGFATTGTESGDLEQVI